MNIKDKLYLATIAEDAKKMAEKYHLGIEVNEFCTAVNMDQNFEFWNSKALDNMSVAERFIFHAPFNEIHPSAIDPLAKNFALQRLNQAYNLAKDYGIKRMVVHSGFLPEIYFPVWFLERSVEFWQEFMADKPADFQLMIENQLEPEAELLPKLCEQINDPRVGLCLDSGHALYKSNQDIYYWADSFAPYCTHLHLHNNDKSWDLHWCLNQGLIDMKIFLPYILKKMPKATITLENLQVEPSLIWLEENSYL
jgi:sugar phosphate isomerase/epimerase